MIDVLWMETQPGHEAENKHRNSADSTTDDVSSAGQKKYHAGQNDYLTVFFEGLMTEFGSNYRNRFFFPGRAYF